jgi:endonuclease III
LLGALRKFYGRPQPPKVTDPFEQILFQNVAYLADDVRRAEAFRVLKERTGLKPEKILAASHASLHEIARRGIGGPPEEARKALKKFPSIGDPGAEKILLFSGALPVLALDSNGLRVLFRLGFGKENKSYAKSYRSAQAAAEVQLPKDCGVLIEAYQLLRRHGQELCKTKHPRCEACPVRARGVYFKTVSAPARN